MVPKMLNHVLPETVQAIRLCRSPGATLDLAAFELGRVNWDIPSAGEVAVRVTHLSMDPFERLRMGPGGAAPKIAPGEVVSGRGVGIVVASADACFREGDCVAGNFGWREGATVAATGLTLLQADTSAERYLSLLGPSGIAAYFSVAEVGRAVPGDTVVVAPAAGSVGSLAGQIAALRGARVVGIARGAEQCRAVANIAGFVAALDADGDLGPALAEACPSGVSLFIDGLGGSTHEKVMAQIAEHARVVLLGFVADYKEGFPAHYGNAAPILFKRARMTGFLLADWQDRFAEARNQLNAWEGAGLLRPLMTVWHGIERAPEAFCGLFGAARPGKNIVRLEAGKD